MKYTIFFKLKRNKYGYSQRYVARQLNISRETISAWEAGRNRPNFEMLRELFLFYKCTEEEILDLILYQENTF